jgi:hypothetical protein
MRRPHDQYFTPASACEVLKRHWDGWKDCDYLIEPCVGHGDIMSAFEEVDFWIYCDIDPNVASDFVRDMTKPESWDHLPDYAKANGCKTEKAGVITNPPFSHAIEIVKLAVQSAKSVAMLLRLSFLEPTLERGPWLVANPPDLVIVLPRISFTGDGKTDSVTCAWMIWDKDIKQKGVIVSPKNSQK